ncbi:MAG: hypothetical protein Q7K55_01125 [Candidatus Levybacteria bacterium]|nr:hypothetical protein [Candidatus Levybacteria bacterium]
MFVKDIYKNMANPEKHQDHLGKQRVMPLEEAIQIFAMQLQLFPELFDELVKLSGRKPAVVNALMKKIGDEISYEPMDEMTPKRMRQFTGAPDDDAKLPEWREKFWYAFKVEKGLK